MGAVKGGRLIHCVLGYVKTCRGLIINAKLILFGPARGDNMLKDYVKFRDIDVSRIEQYKGRLPEELFDFWRVWFGNIL